MMRFIYWKKCLVLIAVFFPATVSAQVITQEIVTAVQFFNQLSDKYASINDYTADVTITYGKSIQSGVLSYKIPHRVRIDFSSPKSQVINTDGQTLMVYLPKYNVTFSQALKKQGSAAVASMATKKGLSLLKSQYSIAYAAGPEPLPLNEDNPASEKVVKLKLTWRSGPRTFKQLDIAVGSDGWIRRLSAVTSAQTLIQFDFSQMRTQIGLPDTLFEYKSPPTASIIKNFLFEPEG